MPWRNWKALLFRKASDDLFELPAYRDVLVLYAVARDLNKTSGAPRRMSMSCCRCLATSAVPPGSPQLHAPVRGRRRSARQDRPTAPVDLDLNEPPSSRDSAFSVLTPVTVSLRRAH